MAGFLADGERAGRDGPKRGIEPRTYRLRSIRELIAISYLRDHWRITYGKTYV